MAVGGSSPPATRPTSTTAPAVDARDVAAAKACAALNGFIQVASQGSSVPQSVFQPFVNSADALLAGAKPGQPPPKWAALGDDLLSVGVDYVHNNPQALQNDDAAAVTQCHLIPLAAAEAGGYVVPASGTS